MSANLKLVVDNSAPRVQAEQGSSPTASKAHQAANPAATEPPWVHRFWVPRSAHSRGSATARRARMRLSLRDDRGAVTAEYAIVIMAAVAFAGLLVAIMRSGEIRQMLVDLVQNALAAAG